MHYQSLTENVNHHNTGRQGHLARKMDAVVEQESRVSFACGPRLKVKVLNLSEYPLPASPSPYETS